MNSVLLACVLVAVSGAVEIGRVPINTTTRFLPQEYTHAKEDNVFAAAWKLPAGTEWSDLQVGAALTVYPNMDDVFSLKSALEFVGSGVSKTAISVVYLSNVVSAHCLDELCLEETTGARVARCRAEIGRRFILNITRTGCGPRESPPAFRFPAWKQTTLGDSEPTTVAPQNFSSVGSENYPSFPDPSAAWPPESNPDAGWPVEGIYAGYLATCNPAFQQQCGYYHNFNASAFPAWPVPFHISSSLEVPAGLHIRPVFPEVPAMLMSDASPVFSVQQSNVTLADLIIDMSAVRESRRSQGNLEQPGAVLFADDGIDNAALRRVEFRGTDKPVIIYERRANTSRDVHLELDFTVAQWGDIMLAYDDGWSTYEDSVSFSDNPLDGTTEWDAAQRISRETPDFPAAYQSVNSLHMQRAPPMLRFQNRSAFSYNAPVQYAEAFVNETDGKVTVLSSTSVVSVLAASRLGAIQMCAAEVSYFAPPYDTGAKMAVRDFMGANSFIPYTDVAALCNVVEGSTAHVLLSWLWRLQSEYSARLSEPSPACGSSWPRVESFAPVVVAYFGDYAPSVDVCTWPEGNPVGEIWPRATLQNRTTELEPLLHNCIPRTADGSFGALPSSEIGKESGLSLHAILIPAMTFFVGGALAAIAWRKWPASRKNAS